jgi:hypothetical protein
VAASPISLADSPAAAASSNVAEGELPVVATELGIWGDLYRVALEAPQTARPVEAIADSDPVLDAADLSFICGFGYVEPAEVAGSRFAAETRAPGQSQSSKSGLVMHSDENSSSCLEEEWVCNELPDEAEVGSSRATVLADLPRDVFTPAPVMAERMMPQASPLADLPRDVFAPELAASSSKALVSNELRSIVIETNVKPVTSPVGLRAGTLETTGRISQAVTSISSIISCSPESQQSHGDRFADAVQPTASAASQPARLDEAVDLTRKALYAWVSVLIGPDAEDLSRR